MDTVSAQHSPTPAFTILLYWVGQLIATSICIYIYICRHHDRLLTCRWAAIAFNFFSIPHSIKCWPSNLSVVVHVTFKILGYKSEITEVHSYYLHSKWYNFILEMWYWSQNHLHTLFFQVTGNKRIEVKFPKIHFHILLLRTRICAYCWSLLDTSRLVTCPSCPLVSYCSQECREKNSQEHLQECTVLGKSGSLISDQLR